jgi:hypothetical protein
MKEKRENYSVQDYMNITCEQYYEKEKRKEEKEL